ncbi:hypothetical protein MKX03_025245 [Papaver bracteatum]|nr:hypothetical protein MKX03_025245 [Papaver bracteatum]
MEATDAGVVVTLNENDASVHATMAKTLPMYVIIQSNWNNRYLHYYTENTEVPEALRFDGEYSFDLDTRFEVEPATKGSGLVHIRSLHNNKYWANSGGPNRWITAMAVKPEENLSDTHCTLFQPVFLYSNNTRVLKLRHASSGDYVSLFSGSGNSCNLLCLVTCKDDAGCTFLDWEDVVMLPDLIRIKGDNGNLLCAYGGDGYMDYNYKGDNTSYYIYEVSPSRDGGIRLKSRYYNDRYWTAMDNSWVLLKQASTTVHDISTVFLPTIKGGNRIVMRCLKNGYICKRHSDNKKTSCLAALDAHSDEYSCMEIEEPVTSRKINNVIYRLADARIYNEKTAAIISDDTNNRTKLPQTSELNLKTTVSNTTNWSTSLSVKGGLKITGTYGVPSVASGSVEISTEVTKSWDSEETQTDSLEVGSVRTVTVPSMARVKASLMATRVSYDIPFSYTQRDVLMDESKRVSKKYDGLFSGNNGYNYKYEVVELPLE